MRNASISKRANIKLCSFVVDLMVGWRWRAIDSSFYLPSIVINDWAGGNKRHQHKDIHQRAHHRHSSLRHFLSQISKFQCTFTSQVDFRFHISQEFEGNEGRSEEQPNWDIINDTECVTHNFSLEILNMETTLSSCHKSYLIVISWFRISHRSLRTVNNCHWNRDTLSIGQTFL